MLDTSHNREDGPVGTLLLPAELDEELPVVSRNGNEFPTAEKLPEHHRRFYIPLRLKLALVALCSLAWVGFSLWLAIRWIEGLGKTIIAPLVAVLIAGIAIIPGYLNAHLISSLLFDKASPLRFDVAFPAITLIVACFNEEDQVEGDTSLRDRPGLPGRVPHPGRRRRLDRPDRRARQQVRGDGRHGRRRHPAVPETLKRCVAPDGLTAQHRRGLRPELEEEPADPGPGVGLLPRHRLDQAPEDLFPGKLVAQGAFSVYRTDPAKDVGAGRTGSARTSSSPGP